MVLILRGIRNLIHLVWNGHLPLRYHPDDGFTRWALREQGYYLVVCSRCEDRDRVPTSRPRVDRDRWMSG